MARELWVKKASVPILAEVEHSELEGTAEAFECDVGGCKTLLRSFAGATHRSVGPLFCVYCCIQLLAVIFPPDVSLLLANTRI